MYFIFLFSEDAPGKIGRGLNIKYAKKDAYLLIL